jgi:hypothetical protein
MHAYAIHSHLTNLYIVLYIVYIVHSTANVYMEQVTNTNTVVHGGTRRPMQGRLCIISYG